MAHGMRWKRPSNMATSLKAAMRAEEETMTADDFVDVQLTAAGTAAAGEGEKACVRVAGVDYTYEFKPGKPQRLTAKEFSARIAALTMNDKPLFEIATQAKKPGAKTGS